MDAVSATELSQSANQQQANLLAMRNEAQAQQQLANMVAQQAQQAQQQVQPPSNPPGVGTQVDTHA